VPFDDAATGLAFALRLTGVARFAEALRFTGVLQVAVVVLDLLAAPAVFPRALTFVARGLVLTSLRFVFFLTAAVFFGAHVVRTLEPVACGEALRAGRTLSSKLSRSPPPCEPLALLSPSSCSSCWSSSSSSSRSSWRSLSGRAGFCAA
jgi:hypothetical protein